MKKTDHYTTLGVDNSTSAAEIKRTYHCLARQHHPDLNPGNPAAEATIKAINAAAEILCDPAKRAQYDRSLSRLAERPHPGERDADSVGRYGRWDGHDLTYTLSIPYAQARTGTWRTLLLHAPDGQPRPIAITIPPRVASGTRIRVAGEGGPGRNGWRRGDLYVVVTVAKRR